MHATKMYLYALSFLLCTMCSFNDGIAKDDEMIDFERDEKTIDEILKAVEVSGKTGLLYFTSKNCTPCQQMQKEVFVNDSVKSLVEANFKSFWIDIATRSGKILYTHFNIYGIPTMVFVDDDGTVIDKIVSYRPPEQYRGFSPPAV